MAQSDFLSPVHSFHGSKGGHSSVKRAPCLRKVTGLMRYWRKFRQLQSLEQSRLLNLLMHEPAKIIWMSEELLLPEKWHLFNSLDQLSVAAAKKFDRPSSLRKTKVALNRVSICSTEGTTESL